MFLAASLLDKDLTYCINKRMVRQSTAIQPSNQQDNTADNFIEILQKLRANKQLILTGVPGTERHILPKTGSMDDFYSSEEYPESGDVEITYGHIKRFKNHSFNFIQL